MPRSRARIARYVAWAAVVAAAYFAIQGGEYSTAALLKQRSRERGLRAAIDSLTREVDSLKALRQKLQSDPAFQERVAREEHGLVRGDKEILYRFVDTTKPRP